MEPAVEQTYVIAGLGNPGREYARTRHNAGFMALERLADRRGVGLRAEKRFQARVGRGEIERRRVILCEPQTFMNASGVAVQAVTAFYQVPPGRTLVVMDDADLPFGQIRMRERGSSGGHHGLESIEGSLGTRDYPRLRIGIGRRTDGVREITGYVLGRFEDSDGELLHRVLERACDQMECWVKAGIKQAMNEFNGAVEAPLSRES